MCLPLGVAGVPFPVGLPRRVRVRQLVGRPIEPEMLESLRREREKPESAAFLDRCHRLRGSLVAGYEGGSGDHEWDALDDEYFDTLAHSGDDCPGGVWDCARQ